MSVDRERQRSPALWARERVSLRPSLWSTLPVFGLAFAGTLLVALCQAPKPFYYDSGGYWTLAEAFTRQGHFSLLNFDDPLRGYVLPLGNYALQIVGKGLGWSQSSMVKLFNALLFALIGGVLAPNLAEIAWPRLHWGFTRRLALVALLVVFWSGYLNFPLSDFPALTMVLVALVAISHTDSPAWLLTAGVACGLATDIRPEYLLLGPMLLLLTVWGWLNLKRREMRQAPFVRRALGVGLLVIGFAAVSLPQSLVSHMYYQTWSFVPGAAAHLSDQQLGNGLEYQRYDTYVGSDRPPEMFYFDETGMQLLSEQPNHTIESLSQYAGLIVAHPVFMSGLMARHIINGLDQRFSTPYIEHPHSRLEWLRRFAGFLLIFLAVVRVLWPAARHSLRPARWRYPVVLLLCCVTSVPLAVEPRYFLPAYLLSYLLVLAPGWPSPLGQADMGRRRFVTPAVLAGAYLVSMAVVWHVVSVTTSKLHFG
jgi:hypothetical protein